MRMSGVKNQLLYNDAETMSDVSYAPLLLADGTKKGDQGLEIDAMHRAYSNLDAHQNSIIHVRYKLRST